LYFVFSFARTEDLTAGIEEALTEGVRGFAAEAKSVSYLKEGNEFRVDADDIFSSKERMESLFARATGVLTENAAQALAFALMLHSGGKGDTLMQDSETLEPDTQEPETPDSEMRDSEPEM
jgi:hypothetical protein